MHLYSISASVIHSHAFGAHRVTRPCHRNQNEPPHVGCYEVPPLKAVADFETELGALKAKTGERRRVVINRVGNGGVSSL
jgi:hypothetical protein